MRIFLCLLLVIICLLKYSNSFLASDTGSLQELRNIKVTNETTSKLCQNALVNVINRLRKNEDFVEVLREKGNSVNDWTFGKNTHNGMTWCMDRESPAVYISWNSDAGTCMNLRLFDKTGKWIVMEDICEETTNQSGNYGDTESIKLRSKRGSDTKNKYAFVNIAKQWKKKSCTRLELEVYMNKELLWSNFTSEGLDKEQNTPPEQMKVQINVKLTEQPVKRNKFYTFVSNKVTFSVAKQDCFEKGMQLLTVKDADENSDVVKAMKNEAHDIYWTSGNKLANKETWRWGDSSKIKYVSWTRGEPNNEQGNEYCMEIWKTGDWNDNVCDMKYPYICELLETPKNVDLPIVEIFVDEKQVFRNSSTPGSSKNQSPTISVHIGLNENNKSDHSTLVLFETKILSEDEMETQREVIAPAGFDPYNFNGIDICIERIQEKDFSCPKTYYFQENPKLTYFEAVEMCRNRSMKLVSIQNEEKNSEIEKEIEKHNKNHYFWTSGHLDDGVWYWNENEAVTYTNWRDGQPDNKGGTENCIEIFVPYRMRWNDQECKDKNRVICESSD